jgi:hypothetical protein
MFKIQYLTIFLISVLCCACQSTVKKKPSLADLEANKNNDFGLPIEEKLDLKGLCDELFEEKDKDKLIKRLGKTNLGLQEASYTLHILGIKYFELDDYETGIRYQHIAADQYLNPLAMVMLARIYADKKAEVLAKFPEGAVKTFEQDFSKSYRYLHWALNCGILTMERFSDRYPIDKINYYVTPLIDLFESKDSTRLGHFDTELAAQKMEAELPEIRRQFEALYPKPIVR